MAKILSKDDILNAKDIHIEELNVPEWGGIIYVKTLSADERDLLEASILDVDGASGRIKKKVKLEHIRAYLAVLGICDEQGNKLFDLNDISKLGKKSASALDKVVSKIQKMSAISQADIDAMTADLKNGQRAASPTD